MRAFFAMIALAGQIAFAQVVPPAPPTFVAGIPGGSVGSPQTFTFTGRDPNGAADITRMYFLVNTNPSIPTNVCHGFYDQPTNAFWLYNDLLSVLQGPLSANSGGVGALSNSQCTLYFSGTARVSAAGTDLVVNLTMGLNGAFGLTPQKVYIWLVDLAGTGTNWVQSSTWTLVPAQAPTLLSSGPATTSALQPTFTFTGRDANGTTDIQRVYFVVNPTPATPQNGCHGFYDRASNAYYLFNDALSALMGPLSPGSIDTLQNGQCIVFGTGSSVAALTATDLVVNIKLGVKGSFTATNENVYVWIVDNAGTGTGWLQTSTWNLVTPYAPTLFSASPSATVGSPQTFTFVGRDLTASRILTGCTLW